MRRDARLMSGLMTIVGLGALMALASPALAYEGSTRDRLAGAWQFDERSGQQAVWDLSGNGNHGVLGGSTATEASDPQRILAGRGYDGNRALRFDGADFVTIPDSTVLEPQALAVSAWVRAKGSPGSFRYIVAKGAIQCVTASYGLYTASVGGLAFYVSDGSNQVVSPSVGPEIWNGAWHHVVGVFRNGIVRLFIDGRHVGSGSVPTTLSLGFGLADDDRFYVGAYSGPCTTSHAFIGDIDAPRVWNLEPSAGDD